MKFETCLPNPIRSCTFTLLSLSSIAWLATAAEAQPAGRAEPAPPATQAEQMERPPQTGPAGAAPPPAERRYDHLERPGEVYFGGFGGYTFGHSFNNLEGTGPLSGAAFRSIDLTNSGVYGGKLGYFFPDRLNWLGFEVEAFNTTPHLKQSDFVAGSHLRVTTLAFNAIIRAKTGCMQRSDRDTSRRTTTGPRTDADRDDSFCPLQPYVGVGLGVFFARVSDGPFGDASDNAVPGFNGLASVRYYMTEHIALFAEYKYNRATFNFENLGGTTAGFRGDYSVSNIVGGLSLHF